MLASIVSYPLWHISLRYLRERPLTWFLLGCLIATIGLHLSSSDSPQRRFNSLRRIAFAAGLLVLFAYLAITLSSLHCFMLQQDEANILSISAASLHGLAVYNPPRSPDSSYSLMYGPFTFLIYRVALLAGGAHHYWIVRSSVVLANLTLSAGLYLILRKFVSAFTATALLTFPLSILLQHPEVSLGLRSDIWIILFTTLAILCSFLRMKLPALILTGVMCGVIIALKISAGPAILFPLLLLYRRFGFRSLTIPLVLAVTVAFAPFALTNFSLRNYISWILFTRAEGINLPSVLINTLFALFLISPCLLMELFLRRSGLAFRKRVPEFVVIVSCLLIAVSTSKVGSGPHYLWHIVPSILIYLGLLSRDMKNIPLRNQAIPAYCIALACTLLTCVNLPRAYGYIKGSLMTPDVGVAQRSLNRYLDVYRGHSSIQMGYGSVDGDYRTELRYFLVYKGQPYTLEGNTARFETKLLPFPVNVLDRMENCKDDVWLVPHSQDPFELWVFRNALRTTFLQNYSVDRSDGVYDAWVCNRAMAHGGSLAK